MLQNNSTALQEKLIRFNQRAEERDAERRAAKQRRPYLNIVTTPVEIEALRLVPEERAKELKLAAVNLVNKDLIVAVFDLGAAGVAEELARLEKLGYKPDIFVTSIAGLRHAWSYYKYVTGAAGEIIGRVELNVEKLQTLKKEMTTMGKLKGRLEEFNFNKVPVTEFLEAVFGGALALGASDIHFEPAKTRVEVRMRLDGVLHQVLGGESKPLPKDFYRQVASRIKLLAGLKLNITDETQDGRFTIAIGQDNVEVRVAMAPAEYGEVIVMRLLDPETISLNVTQLGFRLSDQKTMEAELKKPNGMMLVTGPTGSGKTTTLYAFLKKVATAEVKIITIEDPVEYHLEGIEQTQVDAEAGYTFASGLKSIMRQDPDVILVGEIRDQETAGIAVNASLTGHLVFSTLHTNDAAGAIPRLVDLKAEASLISAALDLVIAQRLVRKLCEKCREKQTVTPSLKERWERFIEKLPERVRKEDGVKVPSVIYETPRQRKECERCGGTGYKGRVGVFELFRITDEVERIIAEKHAVLDIREMARKQGMVTMQEDGMLKVLAGVTSLEEVERVTGEIEF